MSAVKLSGSLHARANLYVANRIVEKETHLNQFSELNVIIKSFQWETFISLSLSMANL